MSITITKTITKTQIDFILKNLPSESHFSGKLFLFSYFSYLINNLNNFQNMEKNVKSYKLIGIGSNFIKKENNLFFLSASFLTLLISIKVIENLFYLPNSNNSDNSEKVEVENLNDLNYFYNPDDDSNYWYWDVKESKSNIKNKIKLFYKKNIVVINILVSIIIFSILVTFVPINKSFSELLLFPFSKIFSFFNKKPEEKMSYIGFKIKLMQDLLAKNSGFKVNKKIVPFDNVFLVSYERLSKAISIFRWIRPNI